MVVGLHSFDPLACILGLQTESAKILETGTAGLGKQVAAKKRGNPNWVKGGASPNPDGYSRARRDPDRQFVVELAQSHTVEAVGTLVALMRNKKTNAGARIRAAEVLLERGWGKPAQSIDLSNSEGSFTNAWAQAVQRAAAVTYENQVDALPVPGAESQR